jgi:hypothetical protein
MYDDITLYIRFEFDGQKIWDINYENNCVANFIQEMLLPKFGNDIDQILDCTIISCMTSIALQCICKQR